MVTGVVVGIDLGSFESYVAYVSNTAVDVVQNEVSKRATSTLIGFTHRERLLGDTAWVQMGSNATNVCRHFKHLLGRPLEAPDLQRELFWSTSKLIASRDGEAGYEVSYKGEQREFSATQVTAMFLARLRELAEQWCKATVAGAVISVPTHFLDVHRQAVLDAARIVNLPVLQLMNEHTATALAYGFPRSMTFDQEKPTTVAFCSMGHTIFSVAIVRFVQGNLQVVCERSDHIGGRDMDELLMRECAAQFQEKHGCDPLSNKKSALKLEMAVAKAKTVLSANSEAPLHIDCLVGDADFSMTVTRAHFERLCSPLMQRLKAVLEAAKQTSGLSLEEIDSVEMVGGSSRVPWVKQLCADSFGGRELSTTLNQEESVARGCALQAALLSPLHKVRHFQVEDTYPHALNISIGLATDSDTGDYKTAPAFLPNTALNTTKSFTFGRKGPFDLKVQYADQQVLPPGMSKELGTFRVKLPPQATAKKIKVRTSLTSDGTFALDSAQLVEKEEEGEAKKSQSSGNTTRNTGTAIDLKVVKVSGLGLSQERLSQLAQEEAAMQADMREVIEADKCRNDLEAFILTMRNKFATFLQELTAAEDWLHSNPQASKAQLQGTIGQLARLEAGAPKRTIEDVEDVEDVGSGTATATLPKRMRTLTQGDMSAPSENSSGVVTERRWVFWKPPGIGDRPSRPAGDERLQVRQAGFYKKDLCPYNSACTLRGCLLDHPSDDRMMPTQCRGPRREVSPGKRPCENDDCMKSATPPHRFCTRKCRDEYWGYSR